MKYKGALVLVLIFLLGACQDEDARRKAENLKVAKKNEIIFTNIDKAWTFIDEPINEVSEENINSWTEWREFFKELSEKPKKTIGAFQKKATALSTKAVALNQSIPAQFNQPQIRSRISNVITKVKLLELFINLNQIPDKKVTFLIAEINKELVSLERQMDKLVTKSKIPKEEFEDDFIRMLDTTRAISNMSGAGAPPRIIDPNTPRVE